VTTCPQPLTSGTHGVNFAPQVVGVPIRRVAVLTECHNRVCRLIPIEGVVVV